MWMKSKWLPTFPLHAANWLADPRVQMLSPVNKLCKACHEDAHGRKL